MVAPAPDAASNRTRPHFASRPVAPCLEPGPLACSSVLVCVVFAGATDLVNILGFFSNFMHRPLCSAMNRMVVLDVLGDLMRLALQAVAHNVLAEQRNTILLALLHLHIFLG